MNEVMVNVSGNIVSDPTIRRTSNGDAFVSFRLAVNEKRRSPDGGWVDADTQFFSVTAFRVLAGNAYHSLHRGQHVLVSGRLRISKYEKDGQMRTSVQIDAYDIGPSLKFGQTEFTRCTSPQIPSSDRLADREVEEATRSMEREATDEVADASDSLSSPQAAEARVSEASPYAAAS